MKQPHTYMHPGGTVAVPCSAPPPIRHKYIERVSRTEREREHYSTSTQCFIFPLGPAKRPRYRYNSTHISPRPESRAPSTLKLFGVIVFYVLKTPLIRPHEIFHPARSQHAALYLLQCANRLFWSVCHSALFLPCVYIFICFAAFRTHLHVAISTDARARGSECL